MVDSFQSGVIDALNSMDTLNNTVLDKVITAANEITDNDSMADVAINGDPNTIDIVDADGEILRDADGNALTREGREAGSLQLLGKEASLAGTGGVALLEYTKDLIQTVVSNVSGIGTNAIQARKIAERKFTS